METTTEPFRRLVDCLTEQKDLYRRVLEVLGTEKNYLILADVQSLIENTKLKEALLGKSRALERIRQVRVEELLKSLGLDVKEKPISEIIPLLPKESAKQLIELQLTLSKTLQTLRDANLQNEKLATSAKSIIDSGLRVMQGHSPESQVYKKQGKLEPSSRVGKIVSKEI